MQIFYLFNKIYIIDKINLIIIYFKKQKIDNIQIKD